LAKYVLNTSTDDLDFVLLGIVCQENQYQTLSSVNDVLKINLRLSDYIPLSLKGGKIFKFSLFHYIDEELGLEYYLIPNTSNFEEPHANTSVSNDLFGELEVEESVKLVKELPKTDYFIILKGEDIHNYQFKVVDKLKTVDEFIQVQTIEANDLPSKRNLIF
jgi:hypothetical protein